MEAEAPTQYVNDESLEDVTSLQPSMAEEIRDLNIPVLVKIEDLFD